MSIEATRYVWNNSKARGTDRLVLLAIADMADDFGDAFPGITRISIKCALSERSTQESIKTLEELGELQVFTGCGYKTSHGRTNLYRVIMDVPQYDVYEDSGKRATPRRGVKFSAPQEVQMGSPLEVQDSAPKPSVEPSVNINASAVRTRDRSYMGIDLNRPAPQKEPDSFEILESALVKTVVSSGSRSALISKNIQKDLIAKAKVKVGNSTIVYDSVIDMYDNDPMFREFVTERIKSFQSLPSPSRPQDILKNICRVDRPPVSEDGKKQWPGYHYWKQERYADGLASVRKNIDYGAPPPDEVQDDID